jgi:hypothetical protein
MRFELIAEGFVSRRQPGTPTAVASGPRCAVTRGGDLVGTFMAQSKLGINDFQPLLARSRDHGVTWSDAQPIWPHLLEKYSIFGSVSRTPTGDLLYFGARYVTDRPGEPNWCDATQGLKQNELFWAKSTDAGWTWTDPHPIPMPIPGSAEAPGPMCVTRTGRWLCCYAPYNTFDPHLVVDRNQVVVMRSDDQGQTWQHNAMLRFESPTANGAEAWVIELADGRLLGTAWHIEPTRDQPNAYALSHDGGHTWTPTRSTGIMGQSTALAALPDGRALFIYNQRRHGEPGVWLAVVRPTAKDFGVEANAIVWRAQTRTQNQTTGAHDQWVDFAFGEPSVTVLPDRTLLVTLWCIQPTGQGIRYLKLRLKE